MSEQPTLQSFFSVVLRTQAQLALLDNMEDNLLGVGDFLSDQAHPQHEAVEEVRRSFRTLRRTLKFLLAIQLREATRNLQMYLMNSGQLPALDMDFEDE